MSEAKGLDKPLVLKKDLAALLGASKLSRTEITKKLWAYINEKGLKTKTENGKASGEGAHIVADAALLTVFKNTNSTSKTSGKVTDLRSMKEGQTVHMMQLASVVGANIE